MIDSTQGAAKPHISNPSHTKKPRVAFIVCQAGGGHHSAARAISRALDQRYPHQYETITQPIENMMGPAGKVLGEAYSGSYNLALQGGHYWLEPVIFTVLDRSRKVLQPIGLNDVRKAIKALQADLVVMLIHGAHDAFFAAGKWDGVTPNLTVVTDAVSIRSAWVHPECDQVIVSTKEAYEACLRLDMPAEKLHIIGHPIDPRFAEPAESAETLRARFGMKQGVFTIMMMMGGTGGRNIYRFSRLLADAKLPVQIVACCGSDKILQHRMKRLAQWAPMPIHVFGYTTEIPELMTLSDVIVTKPGPGTIMEALGRDLPILLDDSNYTMWQEVGNVDYVRKYNLGRILKHINQFVPAVKELMEHPERYAAIKASILKHQKVDASLRIADVIHERLQAIYAQRNT